MNKDIIKKQIIAIQKTGRTNMFDIQNVQAIAKQLKFKELIEFLKTNEDDYTLFIFTGEGLD